MFVNHLDNDIGFLTLEDCHTIGRKTQNFVSNVSLWQPTKNNKRMNDYNNEVVKRTSTYNSFKIEKNWHHYLIINNMDVHKNPRLVIQSGDFITIDKVVMVSGFSSWCDVLIWTQMQPCIMLK